MSIEEVEAEVKKCMDNPYYFATKYLQVDGKPFTTSLSEEEFNKQYRELHNVPDLYLKRRSHG